MLYPETNNTIPQSAVFDILYMDVSERLTPDEFQYYMHLIPAAMQQSIRKFVRWQDAQRGLMGKILLLEGLKKWGMHSHILEEIRYSPYNRPYLPVGDFNISHAGNYVMCVLTKDCKVGIDIEEIKPINISEFTDQFTVGELKQMESAEDPTREFYRWWSRKEAIIKADGKGLSIPLKSIAFDQNNTMAITGESQWRLHEIHVDARYCCHLATNAANPIKLHLQCTAAVSPAENNSARYAIRYVG